MIDTAQVLCPYCGKTFSVIIEGAAGNQDYVEDCQICCRQIELHITLGPEGELVELLARRYDE